MMMIILFRVGSVYQQIGPHSFQSSYYRKSTPPPSPPPPKCHYQPTQQCSPVSKQSCQNVPKKVAKNVCIDVPVSKPRQECRNVPRYNRVGERVFSEMVSSQAGMRHSGEQHIGGDLLRGSHLPPHQDTVRLRRGGDPPEYVHRGGDGDVPGGVRRGAPDGAEGGV